MGTTGVPRRARHPPSVRLSLLSTPRRLRRAAAPDRPAAPVCFFVRIGAQTRIVCKCDAGGSCVKTGARRRAPAGAPSLFITAHTPRRVRGGRGALVGVCSCYPISPRRCHSTVMDATDAPAAPAARQLAGGHCSLRRVVCAAQRLRRPRRRPCALVSVLLPKHELFLCVLPRCTAVQRVGLSAPSPAGKMREESTYPAHRPRRGGVPVRARARQCRERPRGGHIQRSPAARLCVLKGNLRNKKYLY